MKSKYCIAGAALKPLILICNIIYSFMKLLPVRRKITMLSRQSDSMTLDYKLLSDELKIRDTECKVLCRRLRNSPAGVFGYIPHFFVQMYHIATSEVVITDTYSIAVSVLKHRKSLTVIQIWHSSAAIKMFGHQTVGRPDGASHEVARLMRMHRNYSYVTAPGRLTGKFFAEAFDVHEDKLKIYGLPRLQYIGELSDKAAEIKTKYGIGDEKITLLYAPTFRKCHSVHVKNLINALDFRKYRLLISLHPLDEFRLEEETEEISDEILKNKDVMIMRGDDIYELLAAADGVISDYSAITVEASLTGKPLYVYDYDRDEYERSTGLNIDWRKEPIKEYVFEDPSELAAALLKRYDYKALTDFRDKYIEVNPAKCTGRLADFCTSFLSLNVQSKCNK